MLLSHVTSAVAKQGWTILGLVTAGAAELGTDPWYRIPHYDYKINSVIFFNIYISDGKIFKLGLVLFLLHFHCLYRQLITFPCHVVLQDFKFCNCPTEEKISTQFWYAVWYLGQCCYYKQCDLRDLRILRVLYQSPAWFTSPAISHRNLWSIALI